MCQTPLNCTFQISSTDVTFMKGAQREAFVYRKLKEDLSAFPRPVKADDRRQICPPHTGDRGSRGRLNPASGDGGQRDGRSASRGSLRASCEQGMGKALSRALPDYSAAGWGHCSGGTLEGRVPRDESCPEPAAWVFYGVATT